MCGFRIFNCSHCCVWFFITFNFYKPVCLFPQLTTLLRKLTGAAMMSPAEASEEFRHGTVLCLRSVFQALQPCKSSSCSCKYVLPSVFDMLKQDSGDPYKSYTHPAQEEYTADEELTPVDYVAPEVCPLGYLQSLDMAPAIGHLLSLLLQVCWTLVRLFTIGSCILNSVTKFCFIGNSNLIY